MALPRLAGATGGAHVGGPVKEPVVRVLLASGDVIPPAEQLDAWHFRWNFRTYRGGFATIPLPGGKPGLVNVVPLDAYLYGVVSREVSPAWPAEAQTTQAILARTYALTRLRPDKPFDVVATSSDQRYGGIEGESVEGRQAVDATAGGVLRFRGAIAQVAYSACCGGRTADPADIWHADIPYLHSIADPHCAGTPQYRWETRVGIDALGTLGLARAGTLRSVELRRMTASGRPRELAFTGDVGIVEVETERFRAAAGLAVVRSTYLRKVVPEGDALTIAGNGSGHGVGMCQWGARAMASAGASAAQIIAFYFPSTLLG